MSSQYRKIKYDEEGPYGTNIEKYLYIWSHDTVDVVHVYNETGDELFVFTETGFDMGSALAVAFTNWQDKRLEQVDINEWNSIIERK